MPELRNPYTPEQIAELKALAALSARTRGSDLIDHPRRKAGDKLAETVAEIRKSVEPRYTYRELAEPLGMKGKTLRARLARRGYVKLPPSQGVYQRKEYLASRQDENHYSCGHPKTEENSYWSKTFKKNVCATCQREYMRRWYAKNKLKASKQDVIRAGRTEVNR